MAGNTTWRPPRRRFQGVRRAHATSLRTAGGRESSLTPPRLRFPPAASLHTSPLQPPSTSAGGSNRPFFPGSRRAGPPGRGGGNELAVLSVKQKAARCRLLGSDGIVTLRASRLWDVVPGEIAVVA